MNEESKSKTYYFINVFKNDMDKISTVIRQISQIQQMQQLVDDQIMIFKFISIVKVKTLEKNLLNITKEEINVSKLKNSQFSNFILNKQIIDLSNKLTEKSDGISNDNVLINKYENKRKRSSCENPIIDKSNQDDTPKIFRNAFFSLNPDPINFNYNKNNGKQSSIVKIKNISKIYLQFKFKGNNTKSDRKIIKIDSNSFDNININSENTNDEEIKIKFISSDKNLDLSDVKSMYKEKKQNTCRIKLNYPVTNDSEEKITLVKDIYNDVIKDRNNSMNDNNNQKKQKNIINNNMHFSFSNSFGNVSDTQNTNSTIKSEEFNKQSICDIRNILNLKLKNQNIELENQKSKKLESNNLNKNKIENNYINNDPIKDRNNIFAIQTTLFENGINNYSGSNSNLKEFNSNSTNKISLFNNSSFSLPTKIEENKFTNKIQSTSFQNSQETTDEINYNFNLKEYLIPQSLNPMLVQKCAIEEIKFRQKHKQLSVFELNPDLVTSSYNEILENNTIMSAKKEFCVRAQVRSSADTIMNDPAKVRTFKALQDSVDYLVNNIMDLDNLEIIRSEGLNYVKMNEHDIVHNLKDIAQFTLDRFRQVKAEFKMLNFYTAEFVDCFKKMLRFSVLMNNDCASTPHFNFPEHQRNANSLTDELLRSQRQALGVQRLGLDVVDNNHVFEVLVYKIIHVLPDPNQLSQTLNEYIKELKSNKQYKNVIRKMIVFFHTNNQIKVLSLVYQNEINLFQSFKQHVHFVRNKLVEYTLKILKISDPTQLQGLLKQLDQDLLSVSRLNFVEKMSKQKFKQYEGKEDQYIQNRRINQIRRECVSTMHFEEFN